MSFSELRNIVHDMAGFAMQAVRRVEREVFGSWANVSGAKGFSTAMLSCGVSTELVGNRASNFGPQVVKSGLFHNMYAELQMLADIAGFHRTLGHVFKPQHANDQMILAPTKQPDKIVVALPQHVMHRLLTLENQPGLGRSR